jgi:hypothetical protein
VKRGSDRLGRARTVLNHIIVPKVQDPKASPAKILTAFPVGFVVRLLSAISLDDR